LDKAKQGRTTIVIAHRLSTIRNADLIIGLEHGRVIEYGIHDDLMEHKGLYYELVTAQNEKEVDRRRSSILVNHNFTKQSSILIDNLDKNNDVTTFDDPLKKNVRTTLAFRILKLNAPEWHWILVAGLASVMFGATQPLFALFLTQIFALFAESNLEEQKRLTNIYAAAIFLVGLFGAVAQLLIILGFAKSGEALTMRMRKLTFSAILRQEMGYFDSETNSIGTLITRLSTDASSLKGMTGIRIGIILQALSATITALAIAFSAGWKLTFIVICFVPLMIFSGVLQGQKQSTIAQAKNKGSFAEQGGQV
jgi:ABC-type multidrug transport system fused ATPase/permease subunit